MLHNKKRYTQILSLLLTLVMLLTTAVPVFAAGGNAFTIRGLELPDQLTAGESFDLEGTIRGKSSLSRVIVTVLDWEEDELFRKTFRPSGKTFYLHSVNKYLDFADLLCGTYTLRVEVKNKYVGRVTVIEESFQVTDAYNTEEEPSTKDIFVSTTFAETESCVVTFSLKEDGDKYISNNFRIREFRCSDGSDEILIDLKLVALLQQIRDHFNAPVTITSGYRTPAYNSSLKGAARNSYHTKGMAADISVKGVDPLDVAKYVQSLGGLGIGYYPLCYSNGSYTGNFTHVDTRTTKYYWKTTDQGTYTISSFN